MNRRTLLKHLSGAAALLFLKTARRSWAARPPTLRRVRPSDPGWPSASDWETLRQQVEGRLIPVPSPLTPCQQAPASAACAARVEELKNPYFLGEQPGGTQTSGWLNGWTSTPSVYAVAAQRTEDVVAAVNFARKNNLRLVVKGGGHSYQGTSSAADSLLIWTRAMDGVTLHQGFVPEGGTGTKPRPAVTVEAGARWLPTYNAVTTQAGRYVQGGGCATVGVAGLIQSGGFGSFSKQYGMAAASLLQAEVVTADGRVVVANAHRHSDLFWALKGGGGGSFGVVTKVTLATYQLPPFFGTVQGLIRATSDGAFRKLLQAFVRFYDEKLFNPQWGESVSLRPDNTLLLHMVFQGMDQAQATATWKPFLDLLAQAPESYVLESPPAVTAIPARHYWDPAYRKAFLPGTVVVDARPGAPAENVSWSSNQVEENLYIYGYESLWLPERLLKQPDRLVDKLWSSTRHFEVQLHFNKGLAGAPEDRVRAARDTAMHPAVLDAFALALIAGGTPHTAPGLAGHEPDFAAGRTVAAAVGAAAEELRQLVPNAGAYVAEGNYFDSRWWMSFWGANYPRLLAVKQRYDPDGLFIVHHGVGSEGWSEDGFTRLAQSP